MHPLVEGPSDDVMVILTDVDDSKLVATAECFLKHEPDHWT